MLLTLLFFLKPIYRLPAGYRPPDVQPVRKKKKKKIKVYKIEKKDNEAVAVQIDYKAYASELNRKRTRKRTNETLIIMEWMLGDD